MTIEEYAIKLVCDGAESRAEDDLNEDGEIADADHGKAVWLVHEIVRRLRSHPNAILDLCDRPEVSW